MVGSLFYFIYWSSSDAVNYIKKEHIHQLINAFDHFPLIFVFDLID